jgi:hypothetical protein
MLANRVATELSFSHAVEVRFESLDKKTGLEGEVAPPALFVGDIKVATKCNATPGFLRVTGDLLGMGMGSLQGVSGFEESFSAVEIFGC